MEATDNTLLFARASSAYSRFRPSYPACLYDKIMEQLEPPFTYALDIGAGTGISTNALAAIFQFVTAAEPDVAMLAKAEFASNVTAVCIRGEQLRLPAGRFQLITCGNAFYWMDGEILAPAIYGWLEKGGLFAAYRYEMPTTNSKAADATLRQEDTIHWSKHRHQRLQDTGYTEFCLRKANCFSHISVSHLENLVSMTPIELAGFFASTSYGSAYLATLAEPNAYIADLAKGLGDKSELLTVDFGLELILAEKD